jgi:hypothetical protein
MAKSPAFFAEFAQTDEYKSRVFNDLGMAEREGFGLSGPL